MKQRLVLLVVVTVAAANAFALRPSVADTTTMWLGLIVPYALLGVLALWRLWDDGTLLDVLRPKAGDITLGALTAAILVLGTWAGRSLMMPPGSERSAWLMRLYLQIGGSDEIQRSLATTSCVLSLAVLEELVWRSLVLTELSSLGTRRAWPIAALLYGVAHVPTLYTLRDPVAGLNPLLVLAALGCGLVWSFMAAWRGRLPPVIISHMAFSWFAGIQFRLPGL